MEDRYRSSHAEWDLRWVLCTMTARILQHWNTNKRATFICQRQKSTTDTQSTYPFKLNRNYHRQPSWLMGMLLILFAILFAGQALAVTLVTVDDSFGIPFGKPLQVEALGVLENDTLDGEAAGENGATAELLSGVANGTLSCPTDATLTLCADGSFDYIPGPGFSGTDSFTYQAVFGAVVSAPTTVSLTACTGGPLVYACWQESSYLARLAEFGYGTFREGFEGVEWDIARSPVTVDSITSMGLTWTSNHPGTNNITTGSGPARSGDWGVFSLPHGMATGTPGQCDIDNPPEHCLYHDGFSGKRGTGQTVLHGVGGYITGTAGANISIIHGGTQTVFGALPDPGHQFFAVIDTSTAGFTAFKFQEEDGKVGQQLLIFGDDFIIATSSSVYDDDGDGVPNSTDNCPGDANPDQLDTDNDSLGNACDLDDDNDGFSDVLEDKYASDPLDDTSLPQAYTDIAPGDIYHLATLGLDDAGITSACDGTSNFCPNQIIQRDTAAIWLIKAFEGGTYIPSGASGTVFNDVGISTFAADYIEDLMLHSGTEGCDAATPLPNYCPEQGLTKDQAAKMLLKTRYGAGYSPSASGLVFDDVATDTFAAGFIEASQVEGTAEGCSLSPSLYCPNEIISRGGFAKMLAKAFGLMP